MLSDDRNTARSVHKHPSTPGRVSRNCFLWESVKTMQISCKYKAGKDFFFLKCTIYIVYHFIIWRLILAIFYLELYLYKVSFIYCIVLLSCVVFDSVLWSLAVLSSRSLNQEKLLLKCGKDAVCVFSVCFQ